ncbi:MAG: hypothetical protein OEQ29_01900 [Alphaproteobacteria bacterium]|nr:hypothetical protein [Alphaproteobacteria bacterium]
MVAEGDVTAGLRAVLERTRDELAALSWFSSVGQPPTEAETAEAQAYLMGIDASAIEAGSTGDIHWVADWAEAERVVRDPAGADWWAAEAELHEATLAKLGPVAASPGFTSALNETVHAVSDIVMGAAALAAARAGLAEQAVIRVAAGAAGETAEQVLALRLAGLAPDHPFEIKRRLYAGGRWPLGVVGRALAVF